MTMSPEELYLQLGALVEEMPDLANGPITSDVNKWLGRASVLVEKTGDLANTVALKVASQNLNTALRETNAQTIGAIVYTALASLMRRPHCKAHLFQPGKRLAPDYDFRPM